LAVIQGLQQQQQQQQQHKKTVQYKNELKRREKIEYAPRTTLDIKGYIEGVYGVHLVDLQVRVSNNCIPIASSHYYPRFYYPRWEEPNL
jgi:hypothetical protein